MSSDTPSPTSDPAGPESDRATRELLDGFVAAIRQREPSEERFHHVMATLFAVGTRLHASAVDDPELMATLRSLRQLTIDDVLPAGTPRGRRVGKRKNAMIGSVPFDQVDRWLDIVRSTLASLLTGDPPHRSLVAYSQYLTDHGPGRDTAWFVRLAIQALEDVQVFGATSQAQALAHLGATEALPALRRAAQRDYRDPTDTPAAARIWDMTIKKYLNEAIARLEARAPATAPPRADLAPATPSPPPEPPTGTGGMAPADVERIEQAIGRPLPAAVRQFFLNYPPELRTTARELGTTVDGQPYRERPCEYELSDSADRIIEANRRSSGYDADWPDNMLVVGEGGFGEIYWVDLDDENGAVYCFEAGQEPEDADPVADSLPAFARGLIDSYRGG